MTYGMQALATGKPSNVVEKMVQGRLRKYFEENVLLEQKFVVNDSITVQVCVTKSFIIHSCTLQTASCIEKSRFSFHSGSPH